MRYGHWCAPACACVLSVPCEYPACLCQAVKNRTHVWVERVGTDDNISDLPSRESYGLMYEFGAEWREPRLSNLFSGGQCCPEWDMKCEWQS